MTSGSVSRLVAVLVFVVLSGFWRAAWATQSAAVVSFSVTAAAEVPNTRLRLVLQAVAQQRGGEKVLAELAGQLNRRMNAALQKLEATPGVEVRTLGLHSSQVYEKGKQVGWRLVGLLEAAGPAKIFPRLVGKLQAAGLSVESVQAEPGAQALKSARERQTVAAIRRVKRRAALVAKTLGCPAWSLAELKLSDQPPRGPIGGLRMAVTSAQPAPLAPGVSRVAVTAAARMRCEQ